MAAWRCLGSRPDIPGSWPALLVMRGGVEAGKTCSPAAREGRAGRAAWPSTATLFPAEETRGGTQDSRPSGLQAQTGGSISQLPSPGRVLGSLCSILCPTLPAGWQWHLSWHRWVRGIPPSGLLWVAAAFRAHWVKVCGRRSVGTFVTKAAFQTHSSASSKGCGWGGTKALKPGRKIIPSTWRQRGPGDFRRAGRALLLPPSPAQTTTLPPLQALAPSHPPSSGVYFTCCISMSSSLRLL